MGYLASDAIERIKLKAWASTSGSLSDQQLLLLLNDSMRSFLVPFTKALRDEWWVGRSDITLTTDSNGEVTIPDSVASTMRTVAWNNAGIITPLARIEPETSFAFQPSGGGLPGGFTMRGYTLILQPRNANIEVRITAMLRPAEMVLEEDAGQIDTVGANSLTLDSVPLAWQSSTPGTVTVVSQDSPFSPIVTLDVVSLVGSVLTVSGSLAGVTAGDWVSDEDTSPFPNVPIELHPLLEQHVITVLYTGLGDKRLDGAVELFKKYETDIRNTMSSRTQGQARPILNGTAPGARYGRGYWYGR